KDVIKVLFMEEYTVSMAEILIPAADISEQISLAGKEASGTGNMKLMMNGALTVGTLDGANVEILEAVGDHNMYIFGMNNHEVEELWRNGYHALDFYQRSERLRAVIDRFYRPIGGQDFGFMLNYLLFGTNGVADPYMCLADFDSYCYTYQKMLHDYQDRTAWNKRSLINIARSGVFASDVSIGKYASDIWHISPVGR
ncbi:MAG: glycogen/starch/alpha-glucan phosphorylase, partial [Clostridia bacterium]|nr:glycogen/starch/alpha-glucan phosphorylase [Clostridia bacterium]